MARFFRHGELPLVLLALVEQRPMSGYDLMAELGRLFGPGYRPSPGSVYPALKNLEAERLVRVSSDEGAAVFSPTPQGRRTVRERGRQLAELELRTGQPVRGRAEADAVLQRFAAQAAELADRVPMSVLREQLDETLARLRSAAAPSPHGKERHRG